MQNFLTKIAPSLSFGAQKIRKLPKQAMLVAGLTLWTLGVLSMARPQIFLNPLGYLRPVAQARHQDYEVFGFAPYWTFNKLNNVDFDTLTTMAYFGVPVSSGGDLVKSDTGYQTFKSDQATEVFNKAHQHGTRVVLTITQMNAGTTEAFLANPDAQKRAIDQTVEEVAERGIDGANVDFEYFGSNGEAHRQEFSNFIANLTAVMHARVPGSRVTASLYASAVVSPRIYDVGQIADASDGIFMMAYDFAVVGADQAVPTSPLYGAKDGDYWYDISTAVDDFLTQMPADKLILGLPWYGYDYPVSAPGVKASTQKGYYIRTRVKTRRGTRLVRQFIPAESHAATAAKAQEEITPETPGYQTGWDEKGQVGYTAYQKNGSWRMVFQEDARSLGIKYDFAKSKNLKGVGMWALGFEDDSGDFWRLLKEKFGGASQAQANTGERI